MWKLLKGREIDRSPFAEPFKTNEPAHWARPELVAQVRFTEWTQDHKLRHPVYLGLRDDKAVREVMREVPGAPAKGKPRLPERSEGGKAEGRRAEGA